MISGLLNMLYDIIQQAVFPPKCLVCEAFYRIDARNRHPIQEDHGTDERVELPAIRAHMQRALGDVYSGIEPSCIQTWPADDQVDRKAYASALEAFGPGDVAIIFTPDDTHGEIASACLARGLHVMITKPPVKTLVEHNALAAEAATAERLAVVG